MISIFPFTPPQVFFKSLYVAGSVVGKLYLLTVHYKLATRPNVLSTYHTLILQRSKVIFGMWNNSRILSVRVSNPGGQLQSESYPQCNSEPSSGHRVLWFSKKLSPRLLKLISEPIIHYQGLVDQNVKHRNRHVQERTRKAPCTEYSSGKRACVGYLKTRAGAAWGVKGTITTWKVFGKNGKAVLQRQTQSTSQFALKQSRLWVVFEVPYTSILAHTSNSIPTAWRLF